MPRRIGLHLILNSLGMGGAEKHTIALANHLPIDRFRIHLSYLFPTDDLLPEVDANRLESLTCHDVRHRVDPRTVKSLSAGIRDNEIDVVLCTNAYPALYGMLATLKQERPVQRAVVYHTTTLRSRKDRIQMPIYRKVFRRFDLLVFVSMAQQSYWQERGLRARQTMTIRNGIDLNWYATDGPSVTRAEMRERLGFMPGDYVIGICAALRPEKAHGDYLRAIAGLRARGTPARGLIIGDGPQRPDIERQIQMLGLDRHVTITGMQNDVRPYIVACDVMTLTSHSVETFSLATLESMAMRKPVVMTDIGGAREQVNHGVNGLLYRHGDIDALITHLMALSNVALRDRMASDSLERVTRCFSLPTMINAYTEALSALAVDRRDTTPDRRRGPKLAPPWRDSGGTPNN